MQITPCLCIGGPLDGQQIANGNSSFRVPEFVDPDGPDAPAPSATVPVNFHYYQVEYVGVEKFWVYKGVF